MCDNAESAWNKSHVLFSKIINKFNFSIGAEIGIAFGEHANYLLSNTNIKKLYGIDPYKNFKKYDDPMNFDQKTFDEIHTYVLNKLKKFDDRYVHLRKESLEAVNDLNTLLDFIYIDAIHTYDGVSSDIASWFDKIRIGGVIAGHDYDHPNFPGVKKAVDDFFGRFNWEIHTEGEGVWWVQKRPINISFIVPAFNAEKSIKQSILSILKTNFEMNDELIIVDDSSTDDTLIIANQIKNKFIDKKIIIHSHNYNRGGGSARNTAVELSKNELIFCLDSDNVLEKKSINSLKNHFIKTASDVSSFEEIKYFKESINNVTHSWRLEKPIYTLADVLSNHKVPGASGNYLFTKNSWLKANYYPMSVGALDAWGFGFKQLATGSKMTVLPNSYYYHRYGHDSYWVRESRDGNISLKAFTIILPYLNLINSEDVEHILSKKNRRSWFEKMNKRPIRLVNSSNIIKKIIKLIKKQN